MAALQKTTNDHMKMGMTGAHDNHTQRGAKVGPFIRRLLTMSLAMGAGIALFHLLVLLRSRELALDVVVAELARRLRQRERQR